MRLDKAALRIQRHEGGLVPLSTMDSAYTGTVERILAMVPFRPPEEGQVRQALGKTFLMGLGQGPVTATARSLGLDLIHLSLNSLPKDAVESDRGGGR